MAKMEKSRGGELRNSWRIVRPSPSATLHFVVIQKQSQTVVPSSGLYLFSVTLLVPRPFISLATPFSLLQGDVLLMKMKKLSIFSLIHPSTILVAALCDSSLSSSLYRCVPHPYIPRRPVCRPSLCCDRCSPFSRISQPAKYFVPNDFNALAPSFFALSIFPFHPFPPFVPLLLQAMVLFTGGPASGECDNKLCAKLIQTNNRRGLVS